MAGRGEEFTEACLFSIAVPMPRMTLTKKESLWSWKFPGKITHAKKSYAHLWSSGIVLRAFSLGLSTISVPVLKACRLLTELWAALYLYMAKPQSLGIKDHCT